MYTSRSLRNRAGRNLWNPLVVFFDWPYHRFVDPEAAGARQYHYTGPGIAGPSVWLARMGSSFRMDPTIVHRPAGGLGHLIMVFHDACIVKDADGTRRCEGSSLIWWLPGQEHYYGNPDATWSHSWVHCSGTLVDRWAARISANVAREIRDVSILAPYFSWLASRVEAGAGPIVVRNAFDSLCSVIASLLGEAPEPSSANRIDDAKREIDREFATDLTVEGLADACGLTPSHFSVVFRARFGISPRRYIIRRRLEEALWLMQDATLQLSRIAELVGYDDYPQFSRIVRDRFGSSPSCVRSRVMYGDVPRVPDA